MLNRIILCEQLTVFHKTLTIKTHLERTNFVQTCTLLISKVYIFVNSNLRFYDTVIPRFD